MKKKILKEAGLASLDKSELASIANLSPTLKTSLGNVISSLRKMGKKVELKNVAKELLQTPQFADNPELSKFASSFDAQSADVSKVASARSNQSKGSIPLPSNFQRPEVTASKAPLPLPSNFFPAQKQQTPQSQARMPMQDQLGKTMPAIPAQKNSFADQLAARKAKRERQQTQFAQTQPVSEALGQPDPNLQRIFQSIRTLRPEDLNALKGMLNGLSNGQPQGNQNMRTESKKIFTETLKLQLVEQIQTRDRINSILSEGPLDSVWGKLKDAGAAIGNKMGLAGAVGQKAQDTGAKEQANQVSQELMKMIGKTNQQRQKFQASILKNSQMVDTYHNYVTDLVQAYQQAQHALGTSGAQIVKQVQDAVGNFVYDLKSEKEQLDMFLKQIQDVGTAKQKLPPDAPGGRVGKAYAEKQPPMMDPSLLGAAAKKRLKASREAESANAGVTSFQRQQPSLRGSGQAPGEEDLEKQKQQILLRAKNSTSEKDKKKAMNDLQNLFMKQIEREKAAEKSKK